MEVHGLPRDDAGVPQMRHESTILRASGTGGTVSGSVLVCMVLTAGALFGMAAQTALAHLGLDLTSVRDDLIFGRVAQSRSALAWWAWWLLPVASFLVGPVCLALVRYVSAHWGRLRGLRLLGLAAAVLALACVGHLPTRPPALDLGAGAALGALVALLSSALAMVGARWTRPSVGAPRSPSGREHERSGSFDPVPDWHPRRGGGSVECGIPARLRPVSALAPRYRPIGRLASVAVLALAALAAISAVSGAAVMLELIAPGSMRELLASTPPPRPEVVAAIARPTDDGGPRPRAAIPMSASEFTFAKGYARRHAAQLAAEFVTAALRANIQMPDRLDGRSIAVMHGERFDSTHGRSAARVENPHNTTARVRAARVQKQHNAAARVANARVQNQHNAPARVAYDRMQDQQNAPGPVAASRVQNQRNTPAHVAAATRHAGHVNVEGRRHYAADQRHGGSRRHYAYARHRGYERYSQQDDRFRFAGF